MEPFRPFIDQIVWENKNRNLDWDYKQELILFGKRKCIFDGRITTVDNALDEFILDIVNAMSKPRQNIKELNFAI